MNHGQWAKGKPIPKKYRNKMYAWRGGGYDGCFWEMNQGVVTNEGHWDPFHSTGRDGLDHDEWYERKVRELKERHGFRVERYGLGEDVDGWFSDRRSEATEAARKRFYGEDYHHNPEYYNPNAPEGETFFPDVRGDEVERYASELLAEDRKRYDAYRADREDLDREHQELLDETFMDQVKAQRDYADNYDGPHWGYDGPARDRWEEYPLDDDSIRETCRRFCDEYAGTVGVMCGCLDRLAERGYDVWCTCSDCGEQFQLSDYEKFSDLIDENNYHGDGGIGCIFTRVQCEACRSDTECPRCYEPDLPTRKELDGGHAYDHWSFRERFVGIWMGVCSNCADSFFHKDEYKHWDEDTDNLESTIDNGKTQLEKYIETMKSQGKTEEELKELREKNLKVLRVQWAELVNALRDRMQHDVEEHFSDCADWATDRIAFSPETALNEVDKYVYYKEVKNGRKRTTGLEKPQR